MKIRNPFFRFLAGLMVLVLAAGVVILLLYGAGMLAESWWCASDTFLFLCMYDRNGLTFWGAVSQGYMNMAVPVAMAAVLWLVLRGARWVGNRFFGFGTK